MSYGLFNILLYLADTVTHVPYNALLPSLSQDPKQRETIFSFARVINSLGVMFAALAPVPLGMLLRTDECMVDKCAACPFQLPSNQTLGEFCPAIQQGLPLSPGCRCLQACDGECGLQGEREGFRVMGYVFATWHLVAMLLVIIFIEEPAEKELGIKGGLPCLYDAASRARVAALENDGAWKVGGSPTQTSAKVGAAAGSQAGSVELTTPIKKTQAQSVARDGTGGPTIQRSAASTSALAPAADADAGATPPEDEASDMEPIVASINKTFRNKGATALDRPEPVVPPTRPPQLLHARLAGRTLVFARLTALTLPTGCLAAAPLARALVFPVTTPRSVPHAHRSVAPGYGLRVTAWVYAHSVRHLRGPADRPHRGS